MVRGRVREVTSSRITFTCHSIWIEKQEIEATIVAYLNRLQKDEASAINKDWRLSTFVVIFMETD